MRSNKAEFRALLRAEEGADPIDMETEADVQRALDAENDRLINCSPFEREWEDHNSPCEINTNLLG